MAFERTLWLFYEFKPHAGVQSQPYRIGAAKHVVEVKRTRGLYLKATRVHGQCRRRGRRRNVRPEPRVVHGVPCDPQARNRAVVL